MSELPEDADRSGTVRRATHEVPVCTALHRTYPASVGTAPPPTDGYVWLQNPVAPPRRSPRLAQYHFTAAATVDSASTTAATAAAVAAPGEYTRKASMWYSPKVIQFIPAVAIVLIFFLQFAPWVGVYFGSIPAVTQMSWGAGGRLATERGA